MSIKKLYSNELLASFEYSNIDKDYDFYYVTTSDKYIKGGATFLDIDDIKISALQFESGKSFWVMLPKNAISRAEFVRLLNAKEEKIASIQMVLHTLRVIVIVDTTQKEKDTVLFRISTMKKIGLRE